MSRHFTLLCICTVSALLFSQPRNSKLKVKCASQLICASICARNSCPSQCQTYILTLQFYFILTACHIFSSSVVIESACCSYCYQAWNKVSEFTFIQSTYGQCGCILQYGDLVFCYTTFFRTQLLSQSSIFLFLVANQPFISVALIVFGAFIAGARDLSFDARGYAIVFVANITTAVYLATINRIGNAPSFSPLIICQSNLHKFLINTCFVLLGKSSGLNSFGLMWCNGNISKTCTTKIQFHT